MTWTVTPTDKEWSYSGDPTASPLDKVRSLIGDIDESFPLLSDDEILAYIGDETDLALMNGPAADSCDAIAARFAKYPSTTVMGEVTLNPQSIVTTYLTLAKKLRLSSISISAGGLATEERRGRYRRKPFYEGMMEDRESF
jgi:hypothetical protein